MASKDFFVTLMTRLEVSKSNMTTREYVGSGDDDSDDLVRHVIDVIVPAWSELRLPCESLIPDSLLRITFVLPHKYENMIYYVSQWATVAHLLIDKK